MKKLTQIQETLKVSSNTQTNTPAQHKQHGQREQIKYNYHPTSKSQLENLIEKLINERSKYADLTDIDTSRITDMSNLFQESNFDGDISKWDVSSVTNMSSMFSCSCFKGDISEWNVSNVTNMSRMFESAEFNGDISKWNVSNVRDMERMFFNNESFNSDISEWNVNKVRSTEDMFVFASPNYKSVDFSRWNIQSNCNTENMFGALAFTRNVSDLPAWFPPAWYKCSEEEAQAVAKTRAPKQPGLFSRIMQKLRGN